MQRVARRAQCRCTTAAAPPAVAAAAGRPFPRSAAYFRRPIQVVPRAPAPPARAGRNRRLPPAAAATPATPAPAGRAQPAGRRPAAAVRAQQQQQSAGAAANGAASAGEFRPETPLTSWDKISAEDIDSWDETLGPPTPLLDSVEYPVHIKNFNSQQLKQLCKELRSDIVHTVSQTGGHLSSSLGVTELTVAMHYVFNAPDDKIIFDVGHQCYIHKMLTGRRKKMHTIRQTNGLSGARAARVAVSGR